MALALVLGCPAPKVRVVELPRNAADGARRIMISRSVEPGDRDGDGIENAADACPEEREFYDGIADEDGCPDNGPSAFKIDPESGAVEFDFLHALEFRADDHFIPFEMRDSLKQFAFFLAAHPRFTRVEIIEQLQVELPCDSAFGCDDVNAENVRFFLEARGIDPERLRVRGGFPDMAARPLGSESNISPLQTVSEVELRLHTARP